HEDLNNVAVFSHYVGVERFEGKHEGDITIGLLPENAWSWVIPFQGDRTSVGVVCNASVFKGGVDLSDYMNRTLGASSHLRQRLARAERVQEMQVISNYSHSCQTFAGERWMLIGDAAVFLDPIFSSGVHVSVTSARLASAALQKALSEGTTLRDGGLA